MSGIHFFIIFSPSDIAACSGTSSSTTNTRRPLNILVPPRSAHDTSHNVPMLTPSPSTALSVMNVVMTDQDQKQPPPQSRPSITDKNPNQFYTKIRTLRQTLFGKLKLFTRHSDSRLVAIKLSSKQLVMERKTIAGATVSENPQQELNVLRRLNSGGGHRHILQLVEEMEDEHYYWTVLEFAGKGEFFDLIKKERFSDARTRHYFLQMCHAVMHMHACGYCHLDLSLENLLMDDQDELKICDFGLAREFIRANDDVIHTRTHQQQVLHNQLQSIQSTYQQQHTTWTSEQQTHVMTQMQTLSLQIHALAVNPYREIKFPGEPHNKPGKIAYMAPEIFQGRDFDGRACDIWSMGVILFMSLTGVPPFNHPAVSDQRFRHIYTGAIDTLLKAWGMLDVVSVQARDLITRMLAPADRRITMEQILQHPWVTLQATSATQHYQPSS